MKPIETPYIIIALCVLFGGSSRAGSVDHTLVPAFSTSQQVIIERKARKFGLNPNLITAALAVEEARGESDLLQESNVFEWAAENCGRRLTVAANRSKRVRTVFYIYAALGKKVSDPAVKEGAKRFAKRAERTFKKLEEKKPWKQESKGKSVEK